MFVIGYLLASMTIRPIEKALTSQKMLVSNVSHELRTPLAAIIGELDLALQRQRSAEEYQHRISNALCDAHRMSNIIVGLLNMARAEYDKSQIKMEPIRIDELLMELREELLRANGTYHISIEYDNSLLGDTADDVLTIRANRYLLSLQPVQDFHLFQYKRLIPSYLYLFSTLISIPSRFAKRIALPSSAVALPFSRFEIKLALKPDTSATYP